MLIRITHRILASKLRHIAVALHAIQLMSREEYLPLIRQLVEGSDVLFRTSNLVYTDNEQVIKVHALRTAMPLRGRFLLSATVKVHFYQDKIVMSAHFYQ